MDNGSKNGKEELGEIERTSKGLREALFEQIDRLRSGKCEVSEAKAVAALAAQIVNTVHMEIAVASLRRDYPADMKLICPPPLHLTEKKQPAAALVDGKSVQ